MDQFRCPLRKDTSLRLVSSCVLAITGGSVLLYCWRRRKEAAINEKLAKAINDRKKRVQKQKDVIRMKSRTFDDNLRKRIVNLSSEDLLKELAEKQLTVLQVLQAYRAQSFQVDLQTNCITEYLEDAEEVAKILDNGDKNGPLYGFPISIKETYHIKGLDCTAGLASALDKSCTQNATIVASLKKLGAVVFARTNIVQTTCSFGHSNPIYGATVNPHDENRIPGGSSCGEAALIGGRGSLVGFGTDVGGSVRIPAAMSGIFCLKPTQLRLSGDGIQSPLSGIVGLHDSPGIMSHEIQAIITVFKALVTKTMFDLDPKVIPIPFQEKVFNSKTPLTIGYYENDGIIDPTPGCRRAVRVGKIILEMMGHKLIPFTIPDANKAHQLTMTFIAVEGGRCLEEVLRHEPQIDPCMAYTCKGFFHQMKEAITGKKYLTFMSETVAEKSAYELWQLLAERSDYVDLFIESMKRQKLDALLAPGFGIPACAPEFLDGVGGTIFITMLYNMLNFPVGTVPVTSETHDDQQALNSCNAVGLLQQFMKEATKGATGMPLGVQIVGLPWQEELVLRLMKDLDEGIKNRFITDEPIPPIMDMVI